MAFIRARMLVDLEGGRKMESRASGMLEKAYNTWSAE